MRRGIGSLIALVIVATMACSEDPGSTSTEPDPCRLPTPRGKVDTTLIPEGFLPDREVEVTQTEMRRGRLIAVVIIDGGIQSALEEYRELVKGSDYDVLQEDNEGFEAELYLQKGKGDLAVVQIRDTGCEGKVLILLNVPTAT